MPTGRSMVSWRRPARHSRLSMQRRSSNRTRPEEVEAAVEAAPDASLDFGYRGPDRRQRPTPRLSRYSFFGGRRRGLRRAEEIEGSFVDLYDRPLMAVVTWVAALNLADCYFTLVHLQAGGFEVNPFADVLLQTGRVGFVALKGGLIAFALVILTIHKNFWLARVGIWGAAGVYTALTLYHLSLYRTHTG